MRRKISTPLALLLTTLAGAAGCSDTRGRPDQAGTSTAVAAPSRPAADSGVRERRSADAGAGTKTVVFLGTSLTAGYGVEPAQAFPAIVQRMIDSAGLPFRTVNAGSSGETSAGGLRRLDWALEQRVDVLVLELGANDGLRGLDTSDMMRNLDAIIRRTRARYPDAVIIIAGMEAPPNMGSTYTEAFRRVFPDLARVHGATLIPFLLEGVAGEPALNLDDGIHPNPAGHQIVARTVWNALEPALSEESSRAGSGSLR
jgi:acyl-CoA thioesterase-1